MSDYDYMEQSNIEIARKWEWLSIDADVSIVEFYEKEPIYNEEEGKLYANPVGDYLPLRYEDAKMLFEGFDEPNTLYKRDAFGDFKVYTNF